MIKFIRGDHAAWLKAHHDLFGVTLDDDGVGGVSVGSAVIPQRLLQLPGRYSCCLYSHFGFLFGRLQIMSGLDFSQGKSSVKSAK